MRILLQISTDILPHPSYLKCRPGIGQSTMPIVLWTFYAASPDSVPFSCYDHGGPFIPRIAGIYTLRASAFSISSRLRTSRPSSSSTTYLPNSIMQWKLASLSALLAFASATQGFVLKTPTGPVKTGDEIVLFYTANATDPTAAILLVNLALPGKTFVAVEDVPTFSGTIAAIPPCVNTHLYVTSRSISVRQ